MKTFLIYITIFAVFACGQPESDNDKNEVKSEQNKKYERGDYQQAADYLKYKPKQRVEKKDRYCEKYKEKFYARQKKFKVPKYDYIKDIGLNEITDTVLINGLVNLFHHKPYEHYKYRFFTLENRQKNFQDFTVFMNRPDGHYVFYTIFDNNNNPVDGECIAYEEGLGEYSVEADGYFETGNYYVMTQTEMTDPYEDEPGTEERNERAFIIHSDGTIEEELSGQ